MWSVLLCSFIHIQLYVPHVKPNTKMMVKKCSFIHKVPEKVIPVCPNTNLFCVVVSFCFLNHNIAYVNFCPKSLKRSFTTNFSSHLQENLSNPFQSAYRAEHSTETVLLRIVNDIRSALDNNNISVLLLDLSATTDYQILLSRLNSVFGIQSTALQWFQSYLSDSYINPLQSVTPSSSPSQLMYTACLRARPYWVPFSSSCTLRLSPNS